MLNYKYLETDTVKVTSIDPIACTVTYRTGVQTMEVPQTHVPFEVDGLIVGESYLLTDTEELLTPYKDAIEHLGLSIGDIKVYATIKIHHYNIYVQYTYKVAMKNSSIGKPFGLEQYAGMHKLVKEGSLLEYDLIQTMLNARDYHHDIVSGNGKFHSVQDVTKLKEKISSKDIDNVYDYHVYNLNSFSGLYKEFKQIHEGGDGLLYLVKDNTLQIGTNIVIDMDTMLSEPRDIEEEKKIRERNDLHLRRLNIAHPEITMVSHGIRDGEIYANFHDKHGTIIKELSGKDYRSKWFVH